MKVNGRHYRTIWTTTDGQVEVIDQTRLPFRFETVRLTTLVEAAHAIRTMVVRGAPLVGATGAYGLALALRADPTDGALDTAYQRLLATRPTAVNLRWALDRIRATVRHERTGRRAETAWVEAAAICDAEVQACHQIGQLGLAILRAVLAPNRVLNVITHCNAGWLACVDWGTALAPVYLAHDSGIPVHVWVGETRPRNQGASLTAFELGGHGVPHTVIADNAAGHLMRTGQVDLCLVGSDRVAANGDAANKIGTYPLALAARDNAIPFHVAVPSSSIDWRTPSGAQVPIEERSPAEVTMMTGRLPDGTLATVEISAPGSAAVNPAFDVTPAHLITGIITERGICPASAAGLRSLFPDESRKAPE